jgi:hypothetical protein
MAQGLVLLNARTILEPEAASKGDDDAVACRLKLEA